MRFDSKGAHGAQVTFTAGLAHGKCSQAHTEHYCCFICYTILLPLTVYHLKVNYCGFHTQKHRGWAGFLVRELEISAAVEITVVWNATKYIKYST